MGKFSLSQDTGEMCGRKNAESTDFAFPCSQDSEVKLFEHLLFLSQRPADILVQYTGDQGLVRDAFAQGAFLQVEQVFF